MNVKTATSKAIKLMEDCGKVGPMREDDQTVVMVRDGDVYYAWNYNMVLFGWGGEFVIFLKRI